MVGVPGRSKGCNTCIQRKVKCDRGQPACGNCKKANRLCTGYKRPVAFVMSAKVSLGAGTVEDTEDGTITTQGRWRKRERKTPCASAVDPDDLKARTEAHVAAATAAATAAAAAAAAASAAAAPSTTRAIDVVDLSTTASIADIKRSWKRYISYDSDSKHKTTDDADGSRQPVLSTKGTMTIEALSQVIGNLQAMQANADIAMLEFAAPASAHETFGGPGFSAVSWPLLGSPYMQHVSAEPAWREQLFPMFLSFHLPSNLVQVCKTTTTTLRSRNWLMNLAETSLDNSPALETAMTALCMSRVGRKHNNMALVQHSLRLYTEGLRQLNSAIRDPAQQRTDQTLGACAVFAMYEVAECPSRKLHGYHSHHMGGLALLKMRGPDAHISPLGHSLFVFMRTQHFIYTLLTRKSNFLSHSDWISRPWSSSAKDPQDKFMDQMYCIPVLLEQTDRIAASRADKDKDARVLAYWGIVGQYHAIHRCLQGWFRDLQAIVAGPLYWPELSEIQMPVFDDAGRGRPFSVAFHFSAFSIGQAMLLFWLISAIVNYQLMELYRRIIALQEGREPGVVVSSSLASAPMLMSEPSSLEPSPSPSPSSSSGFGLGSGFGFGFSADDVPLALGEQPPSVAAMKAAASAADATSRTACNNICQSVEYFLQERMGDVGPLLMMLPLAALRHVLERMPPARPCPKEGRPGLPGEFSDEVVWVDALMSSIGAKGQQLAYYMDD